MNISRSSGLAACAVLLLIAFLVLPVSGAVSAAAEPAATTAAASSTTAAAVAAAATPAKPFISATVTPPEAMVGSPVTISGVASGANLTAGVQIWIFAGNYINVSTVPVNADGTFSKTYDTTGLPAATYYIFAQSPGTDGTFGISMQSSGQYSGQVVNTKTGKGIFTFTGTGSVQDAAAAAALSDAINKEGGDDVYTKLTFNLLPPAVATVKTVDTVASAGTKVPTTTKSPLPLEVTGIALIFGVFAAVLITRK